MYFITRFTFLGRQGAALPLTVRTHGSGLSTVSTPPSMWRLTTIERPSIRYLVQAQLLSHLRSYLSRVAVDSLTTADDEIDIRADMLDGSSEGIARGQGVGTCEGAVGKQIAAIGTSVHRFANYFGSTARAHRDDGDGRAWELVFQSQGLLEGIEVLGIENGRQRATVDGTFGCHGIRTDVARVGYLFGKYNNL